MDRDEKERYGRMEKKGGREVRPAAEGGGEGTGGGTGEGIRGKENEDAYRERVSRSIERGDREGKKGISK
jgi:hypothetical protein